jgi:hypothetical protein
MLLGQRRHISDAKGRLLNERSSALILVELSMRVVHRTNLDVAHTILTHLKIVAVRKCAHLRHSLPLLCDERRRASVIGVALPRAHLQDCG